MIKKVVLYGVLSSEGLFSCLVEAGCLIVEAFAVLQVREAQCCKVEDRFHIVEAYGVLAFLPLSSYTECTR